MWVFYYCGVFPNGHKVCSITRKTCIKEIVFLECVFLLTSKEQNWHFYCGHRVKLYRATTGHPGLTEK